MMSGCAVTFDRRSAQLDKQPDLFSLPVDDVCKTRNVLVLVSEEVVYFADEKDETMRYTATVIGDSDDPAVCYGIFNEWSSSETGKRVLLKGLSLMSVQHIIESRRVATAARQRKGEPVTFAMLMQKQLDALVKEIEIKNDKRL